MRKLTEFESTADADEFTGILYKHGIDFSGGFDESYFVLVSEQDYPKAQELYEEWQHGCFADNGDYRV